jgi:hypothetical protein
MVFFMNNRLKEQPASWNKLPTLYHLLSQFEEINPYQHFFSHLKNIIHQSHIWEQRHQGTQGTAVSIVMTKDEVIEEESVLKRLFAFINQSKFFEQHPILTLLSQYFSRFPDDLLRLTNPTLRDAFEEQQNYASSCSKNELDAITYAKFLRERTAEAEENLDSLKTLAFYDDGIEENPTAEDFWNKYPIDSRDDLNRLVYFFPHVNQDMQADIIKKILFLFKEEEHPVLLAELMTTLSPHLNSMMLSLFLETFLRRVDNIDTTGFHKTFVNMARYLGHEQKKILLAWMPNLHRTKDNIFETFRLAKIYTFLDVKIEEKEQTKAVQSLIDTLMANEKFSFNVNQVIFSKGIFINASDLQKTAIIERFFDLIENHPHDNYTLPIINLGINHWLLAQLTDFYPFLDSNAQDRIIGRLKHIILNHDSKLVKTGEAGEVELSLCFYGCLQLALLMPLIGKNHKNIEQYILQCPPPPITANEIKAKTAAKPFSIDNVFNVLHHTASEKILQLRKYGLFPQLLEAIFNLAPFVSEKAPLTETTDLFHRYFNEIASSEEYLSLRVDSKDNDAYRYFLQQINNRSHQEDCIQSAYRKINTDALTWDPRNNIKSEKDLWPTTINFYRHRTQCYFLANMLTQWIDKNSFYKTSSSSSNSLSHSVKQIARELIDLLLSINSQIVPKPLYDSGGDLNAWGWYSLRSELESLVLLYSLASIKQQQQIKEKFINYFYSPEINNNNPLLNNKFLFSAIKTAFEMLAPQLNFYEKAKLLKELNGKIQQENNKQIITSPGLLPTASLFSSTNRRFQQATLQPAIDEAYAKSGEKTKLPEDVMHIISSYL